LLLLDRQCLVHGVQQGVDEELGFRDGHPERFCPALSRAGAVAGFFADVERDFCAGAMECAVEDGSDDVFSVEGFDAGDAAFVCERGCLVLTDRLVRRAPDGALNAPGVSGDSVF
jgi:hypothetical protein